jgi:hypothetical protein
MFLTACVTALLAAPPAANAEKPIKPLPSLAKEPKLDGELKDLAPATAFKMPESATGSSSKVELKASFKKDTLYVGITVDDDKLISDDQLDLTLFFPESGTTSKGVVYRFGSDGLHEPPAEIGAPAFAQALVKSAIKTTNTGYTLEAAIPARALPRFQAFKQLALSICVDYADVDSEGGEASKVTTCPTGEMAGGPTRLPDELRKNLKLAPTPDVEGIEAREKGWLGYSKLHYPTWALGDEPFTAESIADVIAGENAIPPASVALPAVKLVLNDNRPIFTILTGKNPYSKDTCVSGNELRMAMYVTKDRVASRVLEWPAATCKLGRAMRIELSAEGGLEIGYTSGTTHHFTWTTDHFERSELGMVTP